MTRLRAGTQTTKVGAQHAEWLSLVEPTGQFLTIPVLKQTFPNGLPAIDSETRREVREWAATVNRESPAEATAWVEYLLGDVLGWKPRLVEGPALPDHLTHTVAEHHTTLRPEYALLDTDQQPRVLVERYPHGTRLDARLPGDSWAATPIERTATLCRALGVPIGIVTDSRYLVLAYAPVDAVGGHATWDTALFSEGAESAVLNAFVAVLGAKRLFAAAAGERLEDLLAQSAAAQAELTGTLGLQVRRAVELLVAAISKANVDADGRYLRGVEPQRVYEAAATVVMRIIFLLYAEERHLLPFGEALYDDNYAVSTLGQQLAEDSDRSGDEPLELRAAAWCRLLATFRAVFAGVTHEQLRMPAYGGSLFDPDRFPFLEGRGPSESWADHPSEPVPVDDLTIREILDALQWIATTEGGVTEARRLSFRALDVEQIGHVYEGTLDHSALEAYEVVVGLVGKAGNEPELPLRELEAQAEQGTEALVKYLVEQTGKTPRQITMLLGKAVDEDLHRRVRTAVDNDEDLVSRLLPVAQVLRDDLRGIPTVFKPGTIYVTETSHRRDTGTEYTPRELAHEIVLHALEPLVYDPGPAQGAERADWRLKKSTDILKLRVCDPAVGSGAILVAVCKYLARRLVEAWTAEGDVPEGYRSDATANPDEDEYVILARRAVADHCVFGVDRDPMAVEMAKLSLWLTTMSRERPFTFVDHAIVAGDSLLGVTSLDQITAFHMDPERGREIHRDLFGDLNAIIKPTVDEALELRRQLAELPVITVRDVERKEGIFARAEQALGEARVLADLVVGAALASRGRDREMEQKLLSVQQNVSEALTAAGGDREREFSHLRATADLWLNQGRPLTTPIRHPLHWPLAFPEVMAAKGFDAVVGNPPYIGNKYWKSRFGPDVQPFWSLRVKAPLGKPDVVVLFLWTMSQLACEGGIVAALATQSVSEVDSQQFMTEHVLPNRQYIRAIPRRSWPGSASVEISELWLSDSSWNGSFVLDGHRVPKIEAHLGSANAPSLTPQVLNELRAFQGVDNSRGLAFVVDANELPHVREESSAYLFRPYLSGTDLTEANPGVPGRYVLDLTGYSAARLKDLPADVSRFLGEVVEPTRRPQDLMSYKGLAERWWTFWNTREADMAQVRAQGQLLAMPAISQYLVALMMPSEWTYTNQVQIVHGGSRAVQALLLSSVFDVWLSHTGGTFGATGRRMKVKPVLGTFPLPSQLDRRGLAETAEWWQQTVTADSSIPNVVLSEMHSRSIGDSRSRQLRENQLRLDQEVLIAYGWTDIQLDHGFYDTAQGLRFTVPSTTRDEILGRLLTLNHARYAEERSPGKGARRTSPPPPDDQIALM